MRWTRIAVAACCLSGAVALAETPRRTIGCEEWSVLTSADRQFKLEDLASDLHASTTAPSDIPDGGAEKYVAMINSCLVSWAAEFVRPMNEICEKDPDGTSSMLGDVWDRARKSCHLGIVERYERDGVALAPEPAV